MPLAKLEEVFSQQWMALVTSCCESLERNDLRRVSSLNTFDDVQAQFPKSQDNSLHPVALQEFAMLSRGLEALRTFIEFVSNKATPSNSTTEFWGSVGLVVKLSKDEAGIAARVPRMLRNVCHKIEVLNNFWSNDSSILFQTHEACFDIALLLLSLLFAIIKFIRNDGGYDSPGGNAWQPLEQQVASILSEIDEEVSRLEQLSRVTRRRESDDLVDIGQLPSRFVASSVSSPLPVEERASLPCVIFPTTRTRRFFDRADVIIQMDRFFASQDADLIPSLRSLALYGLGGVGKSSVALRYAETRLSRGDIDAIFWVSSEKDVSIRQGFTDIAMRLKLPDAQLKDHDENRTLVLSWLQHTKCRWLIVYDNVESLDLLSTYWPSATRGQALITTRNRNFAFDPADGGLEITTWDAETGTQFLVHLLSIDITSSLSPQDAASAHELSLTLSGHALALSHMAGLIYRRSWSISEFLNVYKKMPNKVHGISGSSSINALWDISFRSLSDSGRTILGIMSFLAPDDIPQAIFEIRDEGVLPDSILFCADPFRFSEEVENLLTLALIKRDKERRTFSIHRLVQTSFRYFMTPEQQQQSFNNSTILVALAFPRQDAEFAQMYRKWNLCSLYLPQVLSLRDNFREEASAKPEFSALQLYCELNNACQRYLLEINGYSDCLALIEVNVLALKRISSLTPAIQAELEGNLLSHKGQLLSKLGLGEESVECLKLAYKIFAGYDPYDPREAAWGAENLANGIATINNFPEAVRWQEKAREHWLDYSRDHSADKTEWAAILKKSMGTTLLWAGQRARARDILTEALKQMESETPYNWAMVAYVHYELGTLDRLDRSFESAEAHYMEAQNKWLIGDNLRSDPFNGACMYRMGCVALDQGKVESAIKHLRDSMVVTERHKTVMVAEHARTLFKLSEALVQDSRGEPESSKLRDEAERHLLLRDPKVKNAGLEKTYDDLVCILWR